jgi:hypothetical protein
MSFVGHKLVYIEATKENDGIVYTSGTRHVNLFIDAKLVPDARLRDGIKLYLAYYLIRNKSKVTADFKRAYKTSIAKFGCQHKRQISTVIYYLEHEDHGNLPVIYKHDAYDLLAIKELKPEITIVRKKLFKSGMLQIDVPGKLENMEELVPEGKKDSVKN